jgi:hypothetical protein
MGRERRDRKGAFHRWRDLWRHIAGALRRCGRAPVPWIKGHRWRRRLGMLGLCHRNDPEQHGKYHNHKATWLHADSCHEE